VNVPRISLSVNVPRISLSVNVPRISLSVNVSRISLSVNVPRITELICTYNLILYYLMFTSIFIVGRKTKGRRKTQKRNKHTIPYQGILTV
jgi:hypothetical protein